MGKAGEEGRRGGTHAAGTLSFFAMTDLLQGTSGAGERRVLCMCEREVATMDVATL